MSKAVFAGLFAVCLALIALTSACGTMGMDGCGCGCSACGCGGCADGCGGCGCGDGCGGCGCGEGCGGCSKGCGCGGCGDGCGCGGCGCGGGSAVESDAKHAKNLMKQHRKWTKTNQKQFRSKPHAGMMITNYVNATGIKTFRAGKGTFRSGTVIAKEGWKKGKFKMLFLMEKRGPGYDKANNDWWYATVTAGGKVKKTGKIKMCISCHSTKADKDYVFGNP